VADPVHRVLMAAGVLRNPLFIGTRFVRAAAEHGDLMIHANRKAQANVDAYFEMSRFHLSTSTPQ
jgi:hypothetical protein